MSHKIDLNSYTDSKVAETVLVLDKVCHREPNVSHSVLQKQKAYILFGVSKVREEPLSVPTL